MDSLKPRRKVIAAVVAGLVTFLAAKLGLDLTQDEQAAVTTLAAGVVAYLIPDA